MKITRHQLRRIIREERARIVSEDRAGRLTLWIQPSSNGEDLEIYVNESDISYNLGRYYDQNLNYVEFLSEFEEDHGMPMPANARVEDIEGIGIGDLPVAQAFEAAMDMYAGM